MYRSKTPLDLMVAKRNSTYTPSNLLLCTDIFHVPKCSTPRRLTSTPTASSKIISALLPWLTIHSFGFSLPAAFGVRKSRGQKTASRPLCRSLGDCDDDWESQGALEPIVSRAWSSQSRVAWRSRSFHRPWPKMKA